jgi:hypothetical protein
VKKTFDEVQIGESLSFRKRTYKKLALNMAEDEKGVGTIFQRGCEVEILETDGLEGSVEGYMSSKPLTFSISAWALKSSRGRSPSES